MASLAANEEPAQPLSSAPAEASAGQSKPPSTVPDYKVWNPPRGTDSRPDDLPDSYYEPTTEEIMSTYAAQQKLREGLVNAPLRTKALRDQDEQARKAKWPTTTIRVKFPDRTQLEKTFPSTDKIRSVYAFVRNSLRDDAKPIKFVLYQSPPRREFKVSDPKVKDQSLYDLQLAPSSVLMLSFEDPALNLVDQPPPLLPEILSHAVDLPSVAPVEPEAAKPEQKSQKLGAGKSDDKSKARTGAEQKLAKFLKLGPKK